MKANGADDVGKRLDPRIIRTRKMIMRAIRQLAEEQALDEITVKEIAEKANVNRATFYYHFKDKQDLIEKTLLMDFDNYLITPLSNIRHVDQEAIKEIYHIFFKYAEVLAVYCQYDFTCFNRDLSDRMTEQLIDQLFLLLKDNAASDEEQDIRLIAVSMFWSIFGFIREWIYNIRVDKENYIDSTIPTILNKIELINKN